MKKQEKVKIVAEQNSLRKIGAIRKGELVELMGGKRNGKVKWERTGGSNEVGKRTGVRMGN